MSHIKSKETFLEANLKAQPTISLSHTRQATIEGRPFRVCNALLWPSLHTFHEHMTHTRAQDLYYNIVFILNAFK